MNLNHPESILSGLVKKIKNYDLITLSIVISFIIYSFRLGKEWTGGKKGYMVIPMTSEVDGWKLEFNSSSPLTSLEVRSLTLFSH